MKANWVTLNKAKSDKIARKTAREELAHYRDEIYDRIADDIWRQALAVCFSARETMGDTPEQLKEYKDIIDDMCHWMAEGFNGTEFTTRDAQKHLKQKYGIDFKETKYEYGGDRLAPDAETMPVKRGHWIPENDRPRSLKFICSECKQINYSKPHGKKAEKKCSLKYCGYCGAINENRAD